VSVVLDVRIAYERVESSSDPSINRHLRYPTDLDGTLNEAAADKLRQYREDYNNRPSNAISFMSAIASTSRRLHSEFSICAPFIFTGSSGNWPFFAASGVQLAQSTSGLFKFRRAAFSSQLKSKGGNMLAKAVDHIEY